MANFYSSSSPRDSIERIERELDDEDLIQDLLDLVEIVCSFGDFRKTQKKECLNLVRWMKLVVLLLEEIAENEEPIPDCAYEQLCKLVKAFSAAKRVLRHCHDGSKVYLALEGESMMGRFRAVYEKLYEALDWMPYEELGISDEVQEQIELLTSQLKRCKRRNETQDMDLAMDLMVIFQNKKDRSAEIAVLERLAKKLELKNLFELRAETLAIKRLVNERNGQNPESSRQIIEVLRKLKQLAGIQTGTDPLSDVNMPKYLQKCPSLLIPNEFLCPISLEIMLDPVIIATGQTYERRSIQQWIDAGHRSCPKTRKALNHLQLAPNYALRNLILQWCEKHKVELQAKEPIIERDEVETKDHKEEIASLVQDLSSIHLDVQRKAVKKIRMLSKENPENRVLVAENGGISALVSMLHYPDSKIQENTVTALLNLSIDEGNKQLITKEGAIPAIIEVLKTGTIEAKENSAAALFSLSMIDENKLAIGNCGGISPLVELLATGTIRGKKDATTALFNLLLNNKNKPRAIDAGIVPALLHLLENRSIGMIDEALAIFLLLASHPEGRHKIGNISFIEILVSLVKEGTPKNKECALSVLHELGSYNSSLVLTALQYGIYDHLVEVEVDGTNRAQRKANSLLQLIKKKEEM
ncbi:hypothetical protein LUZ60_007039 [Juncus effusus]|nr:hypothetical protein LUZ60_007039 [Juncus effusus]